LIQKLDASYTGALIGAGIIADVSCVLPNANVKCVRGPFTARNIGHPDASVGDPGLLCPIFIDERPPIKHSLGVVPHYVDVSHPVIENLSDNTHVIDVRKAPEKVVREVAACKRVVSSSLHGMIAADALGVPATWTVISGDVVGNGFKFRDYDASVGGNRERPVPARDIERVEIDDTPPGVEETSYSIANKIDQWIATGDSERSLSERLKQARSR
jgi:hypothetical protein